MARALGVCMDKLSSPPNKRTARFRRFFGSPFNTEINLMAFLTVAASVLFAFVGISTVPLIHVISSSPSAAVWTVIGLVLAGTFISGALLARAAVRRTQRLIRDVEYSERRLAQARQELAEIETAIAERVMSYADLGERLRETAAILAISDKQASAIRKTLSDAVKRSKRAWLIWAINFLLV